MHYENKTLIKLRSHLMCHFDLELACGDFDIWHLWSEIESCAPQVHRISICGPKLSGIFCTTPAIDDAEHGYFRRLCRLWWPPAIIRCPRLMHMTSAVGRLPAVGSEGEINHDNGTKMDDGCMLKNLTQKRPTCMHKIRLLRQRIYLNWDMLMIITIHTSASLCPMGHNYPSRRRPPWSGCMVRWSGSGDI